jgi:hypothetical protein
MNITIEKGPDVFTKRNEKKEILVFTDKLGRRNARETELSFRGYQGVRHFQKIF